MKSEKPQTICGNIMTNEKLVRVLDATYEATESLDIETVATIWVDFKYHGKKMKDTRFFLTIKVCEEYKQTTACRVYSAQTEFKKRNLCVEFNRGKVTFTIDVLPSCYCDLQIQSLFICARFGNGSEINVYHPNKFCEKSLYLDNNVFYIHNTCSPLLFYVKKFFRRFFI